MAAQSRCRYPVSSAAEMTSEALVRCTFHVPLQRKQSVCTKDGGLVSFGAYQILIKEYLTPHLLKDSSGRVHKWSWRERLPLIYM